MSFFATLYQSVTSFSWLSKQKRNTHEAWLYALLFIFAAVILREFPLMWQIPKGIASVSSAAQQHLPEFSAVFKGGHLRVEQLPQPFTYKFDGPNDETMFVAVDTVSTTTPTLETISINEKGSVILVTAEQIAVYDSLKKQTKTQRWLDMPDSRFTKQDITKFTSTFGGTGSYFIAPVLIVLSFFFIAIGKIFFVLLVSVFVWLVTLIAKRDWTLGEVFTVGLFALTGPCVLQILLSWAGVYIPFYYTGLLLVYILGAVFVKNGESVPPEATPVV